MPASQCAEQQQNGFVSPHPSHNSGFALMCSSSLQSAQADHTKTGRCEAYSRVRHGCQPVPPQFVQGSDKPIFRNRNRATDGLLPVVALLHRIPQFP
jgi:hypothetical protein